MDLHNGYIYTMILLLLMKYKIWILLPPLDIYLYFTVFNTLILITYKCPLIWPRPHGGVFTDSSQTVWEVRVSRRLLHQHFSVGQCPSLQSTSIQRGHRSQPPLVTLTSSLAGLNIRRGSSEACVSVLHSVRSWLGDGDIQDTTPIGAKARQRVMEWWRAYSLFRYFFSSPDIHFLTFLFQIKVKREIYCLKCWQNCQLNILRNNVDTGHLSKGQS